MDAGRTAKASHLSNSARTVSRLILPRRGSFSERVLNALVTEPSADAPVMFSSERRPWFTILWSLLDRNMLTESGLARMDPSEMTNRGALVLPLLMAGGSGMLAGRAGFLGISDQSTIMSLSAAFLVRTVVIEM